MFKLYCNLILAGILFLSGCASTTPSSMEFRSAKTSARSERNLKKAEEWALKAMEMEVHATDASVPYFIAVEIYKPQKKWIQMAGMLDEAMRRNPDQKLDTPKQLRAKEEITSKNIKDSFAFTIGEAVTAYRQELWVNIYNGASDAYQNGEKEEAIKQFKLAIDIDPSQAATYIVLAKFYKKDNNIDAAKDMINKALNMDSLTSENTIELILTKAEILKEQGDWDDAMIEYEKAFTLSNNESMTAVLSILEINLKSEKYLDAIEWGEKALIQRSKIDRMYFNLLLYNIGLAYKGAAESYYNIAVDVIEDINREKSVTLSMKRDALNNFKIASEYFTKAREFFLDASAEGLDDAQYIANNIRDIIEYTNETYIPFLDDYIPK